MGPAFLAQLYSSIIADPSGIVLVMEKDSQIIGFVANGDQSAGFYTRLLRKRWWRCGLASIKPVLRNPWIVPRLLRAVTMPGQARAAAGERTLMSIAVLPQRQGQGIGQVLGRAVLSEVAQPGFAKVKLITTMVANDAANILHQRLGLCTVHTPPGSTL